MLKAIILDFDGVILETVDIKLRGFLHVFRDYSPDVQEKVKEVHLGNGGLSRFVKFRIIYEKYLKQTLAPEVEKQLGENFSKFCYNEILNAPFVGGMEDFLEWGYKKFIFFIISGTPQEEIRQIVKDRHMEKYFRGVFGAPETKGHLCRKILLKNKFNPHEVIFIGDSLNDLDGARENDVYFVARVCPYNEGLFKDKQVYKVKDFINFKEVLQYLDQQLKMTASAK